MEIDLTKNQIVDPPVECWVKKYEKDPWYKITLLSIDHRCGITTPYLTIDANRHREMYKFCSLTDQNASNAPKVKKWETIYDVPPELWGNVLVKDESEDIQKATILTPKTVCFTNTTELYKDLCYLPLGQPLNNKWLPFESEVKE